MNYKLLNDEPCTQDEFGAHERIAIAIKKIIETNDGGKVIALIGDWGSGKSSTISMLKARLDSNQIGTFTYDTWVHSGDHLRKSFLNELIDFMLYHQFLVNKKTWLDRKEELAGRLKITEKSVSQKLTSQAKWLIPIVFLLPVASTVINTLGPGYVQDQYFFSHYPIYIFLATLIAALLLSAPFLYLIWFWFVKKKPDDILSIIANNAKHKEETRSIESPEATTIEFQELFRAVMKEAFKDDSNKKLIIVLDNLDRLEEIESVTIWSLLRGFIDNQNYKKNSEDSWLNKLWVIIPMATEYQNKTQDLNYPLSQVASPTSVKDSHFLEKVFQVRFFLPPVVHTDWKRHLLGLLKSTFINSDESELKTITRLFEAYAFEPSSNKSPTPRELKLFINDLATMALMWENNHKLTLYAAYILTSKMQKNELLNQLRVGRAVIPSFKRILNEDPSKLFAAFFFNVADTKKANAMLLKVGMEMSLQEENHDWGSDEYKDNQAFIDILELIIDTTLKSWPEERPESFFIALINLCSLVEQHLKAGEFFANKSEGMNNIRKLTIRVGLEELQGSFECFPYQYEKSAQAMISLAKIDLDNQVIGPVIASLKKIAAATKNEGSEQSRPAINGHDNKKIFLTLSKLYLHDDFREHFNKLENNSLKVPIPLTEWLELCLDFTPDNELLRVMHPTQLSGMDVDEATAYEPLIKLDYDKRFLSFLKRELAYTSDYIVFKAILTKIRAFVNTIPKDLVMSSSVLNQVYYVLRDLIFWKLEGNDEVNDLVLNIGKSEWLKGLILNSHSSKHGVLPPLLLVFILSNISYDVDHNDPKSVRFLQLMHAIFNQNRHVDILKDISKFIATNQFEAIFEDENIKNGQYGSALIKHYYE